MRGIKYVSEFLNTGYGCAGRGYLRALRKTGVPVTWTPMVVGRSWGKWLEPYEGSHLSDDEFGDIVNAPIDYDVVIVHLIVDYFVPWIQRETGKAMIGVTVWELDKLLPCAIEALNQMTALIVPCQWNHDVFTACGVTVPIAIVPHICVPVQAEEKLSIPGVEADDFVFYTIAAWRERNAPHLTLKSYLSAFSAEDRTVLVIKTEDTNMRAWRPGFWWYRVMRHIRTTAREIESIRRQSRSTARVYVITKQLSDAGMRRLHKRGDCYVSLTRAEGWGLGAYEAAFAGKPVIITGYGGQLDFLPTSLSYHVDYRLVPYRNPTDLEMEKTGAVWADPDLSSGAKLMREVFSKPDEARLRGQELKGFVREQFCAEPIITRMLEFARSVSS